MSIEVLLIGALTFATIALLGAYANATASERQQTIRARLRGEARGNGGGATAVALKSTASRVPFVDRLPLSEESRTRMARELERAGQPLRVNEYLVLRAACAALVSVIAGIMVRLFGLPAWAMLLAVVGGLPAGWLFPRWWLTRKKEQRLVAIEKQLPDALGAIAKSLRAGTGLLQALAYAADETPAPLGPELQGTLRDLQLGADAEVVFTRLSERVGSPDLDIAVTAILIQRTAGGNLSEILATVTNTVRDRAKIQSEIRVLTSRQRLTGNLVAALPVLVVLAFVALSPRIGSLLINTTPGRISMGIGLAFEAIGLWLIRRLGKIEV